MVALLQNGEKTGHISPTRRIRERREGRDRWIRERRAEGGEAISLSLPLHLPSHSITSFFRLSVSFLSVSFLSLEKPPSSIFCSEQERKIEKNHPSSCLKRLCTPLSLLFFLRGSRQYFLLSPPLLLLQWSGPEGMRRQPRQQQRRRDAGWLSIGRSLEAASGANG